MKEVIEKIKDIDELIKLKINKLNYYKVEEIFYIFAFIFNPIPIILYITLIFYLFPFKLSFKILLTVLIGVLFTTILKRYFKRERPKDLYNRKYDFRSVETNYSMPSGDSLQSGLWAFIVYLYFNNYFLLFVVPLVMFSRCYYYCHFFSDTLIGSILGMLLSCLVYGFSKNI